MLLAGHTFLRRELMNIYSFPDFHFILVRKYEAQELYGPTILISVRTDNSLQTYGSPKETISKYQVSTYLGKRTHDEILGNLHAEPEASHVREVKSSSKGGKEGSVVAKTLLTTGGKLAT